MLIYLLKPIRNVFESSQISAIVYQDDPHGSPIVSSGDSAEPFLASCAPHLKLDSLIFDVNFLDFEVNAL